MSFRSAVLSVIFAACVAVTAQGQTSWIGTTGDWTNADNWDSPGYPDVFLDTTASVSNGGTANVVSDVFQDSPAIFVGDTGNGTLNVTGSSARLIVSADFSSAGNVDIGVNGGVGTLDIQDGTLDVSRRISTPTSGDFSSLIRLGGAATLTADSAFFDRQLRIEGSGVDVRIATDAILGQGGRHTWVVPMSGPSILDVGGQLDLGGTLSLELPGQLPTVGTTITLADSASVINQFGSIVSPQTTNGAAFSVQTVPGGDNGILTQAVLEQRPILEVNRTTGAVAMKNLGDAASIDFDAYVISSDLGVLAPANWSSLADQGIGTWVEANPQVTALSELDPIDSLSMDAQSSIELGNVYDRPVPAGIGESNEDIRFRYAKPNENVLIEGEVRYVGTPNYNFILNVDPTTGETHLWNPSPLTESIDVYQVSSASGSLLIDDANWNSLDDQNADDGTWQEANVSPSRVAELQVVGTTELSPGTTFNLGTLFDGNGTQDLVFEYALPGDVTMRQGLVIYGTFETVNGDFNNDGNWDCVDIDALSDAIASQSGDLSFDMNGDGVLSSADLTDESVGWLAVGGAQNAGATGGNAFLIGDANLDGVVDVSDFNLWNSNKFANTTAWCQGNFNADGVVDVSDFNQWNANKFNSSSDASVVPEPEIPGLLVGCIFLGWLARRKR